MNRSRLSLLGCFILAVPALASSATSQSMLTNNAGFETNTAATYLAGAIPKGQPTLVSSLELMWSAP